MYRYIIYVDTPVFLENTGKIYEKMIDSETCFVLFVQRV